MPKLFLLLLTLLPLVTFSQDFTIPADYSLNSDEDYVRYEPYVVKGVDYLLNSPVDQDPEKRMQVNSFLLQWIGGSSRVSIGLQDDIVTFMDCDECLMVFIGGWGKYAIEAGDSDTIKGNVAGLESVIRLYKNNRHLIGKSEAVEKYIHLKEKGELESYVASKV